MVKSLILMRHAEREDRAMENEGKDWISTALRPQDPLLSEGGKLQASIAGKFMANWGITKILTSPMIRAVMTSDIIAQEIGLGANSINVEMGLVEEAKSFRGKTSDEPRPNWNPLVLQPTDLMTFSPRLNLQYVSLVDVRHYRDETKPNTVAEIHETLVDRDEITLDRCSITLKCILDCPDFKNDIILCVGHGATVKGFTKRLEEGLPKHFCITGERNVSCFAQFNPIDANNVHGPWKATTTIWLSGNAFETVPSAMRPDELQDAGYDNKEEKK